MWVLLLFFGTLLVCVVWGITAWVRMEQRDEKMAADERTHLDENLAALFDGSPNVTYVPRESSGGLPLELLVQAATARGYRFIAQTGGAGMTRRVVFERVSAG